MRAVVTRVKRAEVTIGGVCNGKIGQGLLILLGIGPEDNEAICEKMVDKILGLRIFEDGNGKMNRGLSEIGGQVMVVSQFTLYGNCRKGRRPSFAEAAAPDMAIRLYNFFLTCCQNHGFAPEHGEFGADMQVESINDGPVTLWLDSNQLF